MTPQDQLHPRVAAFFYGRFPRLHPAQQAALEPLLAGRNIVLSAGTGSGKTEAVVVPLISRGWLEAVRENRTFLLYICPTKALINDVAGRLRPIMDGLGLRLAIRHGDRNELDAGSKPHVLITTPESLNVMLSRREPCLKELQAMVIDEVHLLYNSQRGFHLSLLLHRLRRLKPGPIQWAALSATVARLDDIRDFLFGPSEPAELLGYPSARTIEAHIRLLPSDNAARAIFKRLMDAPHRKLLVFANSRRECEAVADMLQQEPALRSAVHTHYSSLSPELRESTEKEFASTGRAICVATSTLEMGIDIGDIDAVALWGCPHGVESFLQRIGRGNRRSHTTNAICLVTRSPSAIRDVLTFATLVHLARDGRMPLASAHHLYGAAGQQCLSILEQREGAFTRIQEFADELAALPHLDRPAVELVLAELASNGLCQRHGFKNQYGASDGLWELSEQGMLFGNFPLGSQTVDLRHGKRLLGSVPRLNLLRIHQGDVIRFAGRHWSISAIRPDGVHIEPSNTLHHDVELSYGGAGRDGLDPFLMNNIWAQIFSLTEQTSDMDQPTWKTLNQHLAAVRAVCTAESLPLARTPQGVRYYTFAGSSLNKVLARWAGGQALQITDAYIEIDHPVDWSGIPTTTLALLPAARPLAAPSGSQTIFQQKLPADFQERELSEAWLKDEEIPHVLHRLQKALQVPIRQGLFQFMNTK